MRRLYSVLTFLSIFLFVSVSGSIGQSCLSTLQMSLAFHDTTLACSQSCFSLSGTATNIRGTSDYSVQSIAYTPYTFVNSTPAVNLLIDDRYTDSIKMSFPFCFYDSSYNRMVIGTNGVICFDKSKAGGTNTYQLLWNGTSSSATSGSPILIPSDKFDKAMIMAPYHDINPATSSTGKKIDTVTVGTAPCRKFILTYYQIAMFSCSSLIATHQVVLNESTGIIEMYIRDKPICTSWNQGRAIVGLQNWNRDKAVAAPNRNNTVWGGTGINEAWQFTPNGASLLQRVELVLNGQVVAVADTTYAGGQVNFNFPNICPGSDNSRYYVRAVYQLCSGGQQITILDSVNVVRPSINVRTINDTTVCANTQLALTTSSTSGSASYSWSPSAGLNNASALSPVANIGTSNITYVITAQNGACVAKDTVNVSVINVSVRTMNDTSVCSNSTITLNTTGVANQFSWSPYSALSNANALSPQAYIGNNNISYVVTATTANCTAKDTVNITVLPTPFVDAGPDLVTLIGDPVQLNGNAAQGTYLWSPATGLSTPSSLYTYASPTQTTVYTLQVINTQGCVATDAMTVTVIPYCVKIMNAFTPNGDGINDLWRITQGVSCTKNITAAVYDRYGSKVFESKNYNNDWNGTYKGKPLPDATYYYYVLITLINDRKVELRGDVTILR